ncbi:MAG: polysaccharide biosynthesis protein [Hyphomicrobiales bacterium]|nr:polysaccharide biosynthesis protein [Hyphomicrobiales bacterium]
MIGTIASAGLGFVFWWLAARLFPPETIGRASALFAVMGLIAMISEAGLGTVLVGEIVRHHDKKRGLVAAACVVGPIFAAVLSAIFMFTAEQWEGSAHLIDGVFVGSMFVAGCALTSLSLLFDQALVGMLRTTSRMIRQALFSLLKLGLLLIAIKSASETAIMMSWVLGMLASFLGLEIVRRREVTQFIHKPDFGLLHSLRGKVLDHFQLDFALQAPGVAMPYLVLLLLSPVINAAFSALWMVVTMISIIPAALAMVLFPAVRSDPEQTGHHIRLSLALSMVISFCCGLFIFFSSQQILGIFNPAYPDIAGLDLRHLGFGLIGLSFKMHAGTLARLTDTMARASKWFALSGLLEIGCAIAGAKLGGLHGLVIGWTAAVSMAGAMLMLKGVAVARTKLSGETVGTALPETL